jgi:thiol:disulfide interchange protein DsbG
MVGVIKPESPATAAAILTSKDPAKTWHDYEQSGGKLKLDIPANVALAQKEVLNNNQKLMDALGANATPAIYYLNDENMLQQVVGLPDPDNLKAMMGAQ